MTQVIHPACLASETDMQEFDVVSYVGTSKLTHIPHRMGRVPELIAYNGIDQFGRVLPPYIVIPEGSHYYQLRRDRSDPVSFRFFGECLTTPILGITDFQSLSYETIGLTGDSLFNVFGNKYNAHVFVSEPGINKIGIFEGNGKVINIDCGFTKPAEQVIIKSLEHGDWHVLRLVNNVYVETESLAIVPNGVVFPTNTGFGIYNDDLTDINLASVRYLFMAFQGKDNSCD